MFKYIVLCAFFFLALNSTLAQGTDTLNKKIEILTNEINNAKSRTEEIRNGQINYSIEKEVLKETYSANLERLNIMITLGLGIAGLLTFFGIKDVNSIKKDFKMELDAMKALKAEFEVKSQNFDTEKTRFDSEIKKIINQNEEQNQKIKVLELKEKLKKLMDENQNTSAYEYCTVALELSPNDLSLLTNKAILLCRLDNFGEAASIFETVYNTDKSASNAGNYVESLYFINQVEKARDIMAAHYEYFHEKQIHTLKLFEVIEKYFSLDEAGFKSYASTLLNFKEPEILKKHIPTWQLNEAIHFIHYQPPSNKKTLCQNILWYFDGSVTAKVVSERNGIVIPPQV